MLREETLEALLTRTNGDVGLDGDVGIGLGWFVSDPEMDYAGASAGTTAAPSSWRATWRSFGTTSSGVIVMTNSMTGGGWRRRGPKDPAAGPEEKRGICPPPSPTPDPSPVVTWTDEALDGVAGIYVTTSGYDRIVRVPGGLEWIVDAGRPPRTRRSGGIGAARRGPGAPPGHGWARPERCSAWCPGPTDGSSSPDSQERQIEFKDLGDGES